MNAFEILTANKVPVEKARLISRALDNHIRMKILEMLTGSSINVTEITRALGMDQSTVSMHLRILRESGLLSKVREGKWVKYAIDESKVEQIVQTFSLLQ
ncbi:MAG TPA: metalloregulator ArsR/SmtB family transcription factor [Puia sp.]|jgi:ArsR family transcriptional regulator